MPDKEYILCAAIHFDDGKEHVHQPKNIKTGYVICGRRHHNCFGIKAALTGKLNKDDGDFSKNIQGFLTSTDMFVGRVEAVKIALASGQIEKWKDMLFSEDLY